LKKSTEAISPTGARRRPGGPPFRFSASVGAAKIQEFSAMLKDGGALPNAILCRKEFAASRTSNGNDLVGLASIKPMRTRPLRSGNSSPKGNAAILVPQRCAVQGCDTAKPNPECYPHFEHGTLAWITQSKRYVEGGSLTELADRSL
jgi:hypothetical protein